MTQKYSVIIDGVRSPIGLKNGKMLGILPDELCSQVVKKLIKRNSNLNPALIEDLILGCAFPEGSQGMLMARGVGILSDLPIKSAAKVINRFCGSSMDAVHQISQAIHSEDIEAGIAAGVEDMFSVPMGGFNPSFNPDLYEKDYYIGMGETAENLAVKLNISREDQEEFAMNSHKKSLNAIKKGFFENEIVSVVNNGLEIKRDEGPRDPDIGKIKSLEPAFDENGTITAATSSPISIGASALLITSNGLHKQIDSKRKFKILSRAIAGVEWTEMGKGPIPATEKALRKAKMSIKDIDVIELNEAFAAQSLYVIRKAGWDINKINLNGGSIALGHPLGCSGARILVTLMNVMEQNNLTTGLATMCIGTGQGIATIIERI
ncbi:MAG: thiolase family protein [Candidatus Neomarinimicrobiota bacterium]|nr:thiolase family protein [Candidatus Neomarinimicrobiota bacterium]